jgi:hypothetical protein
VLAISLETRRRLPGSFEPGLAGRPKVRTITACFGFLIVVRPIFGIATPTHLLRATFSDKCLKKWYLLPIDPAQYPLASAC